MASDDNKKSGDGAGETKCPECPVCVPGLPMWMATFSDMCTLLLTFFILLLTFAKFEDSKAKSVSGAIQDAFGGNSLQPGEVIMQGRTNDNRLSMLESQNPAKPFPIEFLSAEGVLDKHEVNRESTEVVNFMKADLEEFDLLESVDIFESSAGAYMRPKDLIYFKEGTSKVDDEMMAPFQKLIDMSIVKGWTIFIEGHAATGERSSDGAIDSFFLSSLRSAAVTKYLIQHGVLPNKISTVFYGDSRPRKVEGISDREKISMLNRRVELMLRKTDLQSEGRKAE